MIESSGFRLCIDPGLRWCGVAVGDPGPMRMITAATLVINPDSKGRGPAAWFDMAHSIVQWTASRFQIKEIYLEVPRIYPRPDQRKGDLNDLIELAGVVGAVACAYGHALIRHYYPSDWKGQVPKNIMTERIRKQLRPVEIENIVSVGARDHNTLDAVGIFLHSCGRL